MSPPDPHFLDSDTDLRRRLMEAEETLAAIRLGEVDAVVVDGPAGQQVYCLESPEEPFRIFVERMQEGAVTVSGEGTIVYCNQAFATLLGRRLEQVRGQPLAAFIAEEQQGVLDAMLEEAADEVVRGESLLRNAEGGLVPVQLAFNRLPAEQVRMFGVVVTDMTERQRAAQLESQRQAAEEAKVARDQFLAIMSHELRTPLSAILGWTQVLKRREDLPELVEQGLEVILRNAWSQSRLIEDLLDVSRILAGKLRLEAKPTDLTAAIRAAAASAQPSADARNIRIHVRAPQAPVRVRGDANRLQQIVSNLLSNAVKFSPEQGQVWVDLHERAGAAEIVVSDRGAGISLEYLPKVFEVYQQFGDTGGLGLGLAIVRQLTELHGGEVTAHSAGEGQGAAFRIRLPLLRDADEAAEADGPRTAMASLAGLRLLVVEDQQDEREALVHMLAEAGATIFAAASAAEALAMLEQHAVDLVLCDIGLPDVDGYELIGRIRAGGRSGRDLPAVAIAALDREDRRRQALLAGFQTWVAKPVDQDELQVVVAHLLGDGRGDTNGPT